MFTGPNIVTDGLVLALDAANVKSYPGSGTTWYDLSGNGNNGTLTSGPTFNNGNGGSIVFDGVNDYISLNSPITLATAGATINTWFYITDFSTNNNTDAITLFSDTSSFNSLISFWNGGFGFETNTNSNPVEFFGQTTAPITEPSIVSGVWINFVLVFDTTAYTYINGNLVNTIAIGNSLTFRYIGRAPAGGRQDYPDWHHGSVSKVLTYNRALTAEEVLQNYNATKSRFNL